MGSPTSKYIGKQIRALIGKDDSIRSYDLRGSVTQQMKQSGMSHLEFRYLTEHTVSDIMNEYTGIKPKKQMKKYFQKIKPLLKAIKKRYKEMSLKVNLKENLPKTLGLGKTKVRLKDIDNNNKAGNTLL